ncbi:MAG: hypothetical protein R3B81_11260 [bacterium]
MVESSDLQAAILRTQATERLQALHNQQEELERKRFELTMARERAEKAKKAQEVERGEGKRVVRDRWERGERDPDSGPEPEPREDPGATHAAGEAEAAGGSEEEDGDATHGGGIDVRV